MGRRRDKKGKSFSPGSVAPYNSISENVVLVNPECPVCMAKVMPSMADFIRHMGLVHKRLPSEGECFRFRGIKRSVSTPLDEESTSVYTVSGGGGPGTGYRK